MAGFRKGAHSIIWWPVRVAETVDGGEVEITEFKARMRKVNNEVMERLNQGQIDPTEVIREHVLDWEGITDAETGKEVPYSVEALNEILAQGMEPQIAFIYALRSISGGEAARKNSATLRA